MRSKRKTGGARAADIARFLGGTLRGRDVRVTAPRSLDFAVDHSLLFAREYDATVRQKLAGLKNALLLVSKDAAPDPACPHIRCENPRLDFARAVKRFFTKSRKTGVARTAVIGRNVRIGARVTVGEYCVIGDNVGIGDDTEIRHHVVIADNVTIGRGCLIRSHAVIGEEGFGFERDKDGVPVRLPHLGSVIIGDDVEIGALNTVARATLNNTVIEDHVKIDDHVHVAHNVVVGRNTIVTACAEISGSTQIGRDVWLGPNSSVTNKVRVGDRAFVGIGAVVIKSIRPERVVSGNPARKLR